MEYKKKYNFIVCFMLFVITLSATMFFFLPKMKDVESEKNNEISDIRQEEDQAGDNSSTLNEVEFYYFNTALRHAYNYLDNTAGYKSYCYGKFSLNIKNLVNIEQTIKTTAEINNKNSTSHVTVCTYGDGKIKNNTGFEFVKIGDQVDMRKSNERISGGFNYDNKDVVRYAMEDYLKEWNIAPEEAFTKISINKIIDGNLTKSGENYKLIFTLEEGELINNTVVFVKRFFDNSENSKRINPSFTNVSVELMLDKYGRPIKAQYSTKFYNLNLYGVGIPLSGLSGAVSYTQQFYGFGQNIQIERLPDKV